jgi:hypothetical protein
LWLAWYDTFTWNEFESRWKILYELLTFSFSSQELSWLEKWKRTYFL